MSFLSAILVFGVLIFIHELGHFVFAKIFGVKVIRFSIGFGPVIFSKKLGETEYALSLIPLGGYVKMYGENPDEEEEVVEEKDKAFMNKPVFKRFLIVFAGPAFNYLLAVLVFALIFTFGVEKLLPIVGEIKDGMPAQIAGLKPGDKIVEIDGEKVRFWEDIGKKIKPKAEQTVEIKVEREGKVIILKLTPKAERIKNIFGEDQKVGLIGIMPKESYVKVKYGLIEAINLGFEKTYEITKLTILGIIKIFQKVIPADNIGGPIMIIQMASETAKAGFSSLLAFMAVISINLAILNLLPIPVLDGGHLLFYLIEMIIRRPVSLKIRMAAQYVGLALLISLMFFAFYNDIMRIIKK
ncbi:RIP metalloprotease RseP [Deferribacter thermophilus]|uniref:RIP metalloprotease RseP n=1 Tax=Deferribacter thermophilus TaxID=53573 RepID=UPI003C249605